MWCGVYVRWTSVCECLCCFGGDKLYPLGRALFLNAGTRGWKNTRRTPPPPPGRNRGAKRRRWGQIRLNLAAPPPPPPPSPQTLTDAPKDLDSEFATPRKRGKRRLSSDSSSTEGESLDSCTPMKITRVGEYVMSDTVATPPTSPTGTIIPAATTDQDYRGKKSPQPSNKPQSAQTTVQKSQPDGNSRRKQFQKSTKQAPAFVYFPVVINDLGGGWARFDKLGPTALQRGGSSTLY